MLGRIGRLSGRDMIAVCWRLKASAPVSVPIFTIASTSALSPSRAGGSAWGSSSRWARPAPSRSASAISCRRAGRCSCAKPSRARVEQRQLQHAPWRLADDLIGNEATHRQAGERRTVRAHPARIYRSDRRHRIMAGVFGRPACRQCRLAPPSWAPTAPLHSRPGTSTDPSFAILASKPRTGTGCDKVSGVCAAKRSHTGRGDAQRPCLL